MIQLLSKMFMSEPSARLGKTLILLLVLLLLRLLRLVADPSPESVLSPDFEADEDYLEISDKILGCKPSADENAVKCSEQTEAAGIECKADDDPDSLFFAQESADECKPAAMGSNGHWQSENGTERMFSPPLNFKILGCISYIITLICTLVLVCEKIGISPKTEGAKVMASLFISSISAIQCVITAFAFATSLKLDHLKKPEVEEEDRLKVCKRNKKGKQERDDFFRDGIRCLFGLNSTHISCIQDPIRHAWSFYGCSYIVIERNLKRLDIRQIDDSIVTPFCNFFWSCQKRVDKKGIVGEVVDINHATVDRNIAKLIEHKHRTANDIEKNPGPPMVNIRYMKLFFTFDSNQQKNYTNGLVRRIRHLYADTMKNKIPMKLYNEENLDIIQNIFGLCIKGNFDSDIMALIDFLNSHWYEKVREIEDGGEAVVASDELKEEYVVTGQDQAVAASPLENVQLSSGVENKTPHRNRSSYEVVKKEAHWECPWCKKAFRRRNGCNKHMQVRHPYGGNHEALFVTPVPNSTNSTVTSEFMVVDQSEVFNIDESLSMPAITGTAGEWRTFQTPEYQLANPVLLYQEPPAQSHQESPPQVAPLLADMLGN